MKKHVKVLLSCVLVFSLMPFMSVFPVLASGATTSVTVTKLANDETTILNQVTVTVEEMMANSAELPVYGDGVTHYYFQGPSFDEKNMWDETELVNVNSRDYGACKGNDVKDLCELAGGASAGDEIKIKSPDGFYKMFAYEDVYNPEPEQGKLVVTWHTKDAEETGDGYVTDGSYSTGMRLIFFAETLNPDGKHVFGTWDMHECLAEKYWHYYYDGGTYWPSSSGLSVKWVSDIIIYSSEEPQLSPTPTPTPEIPEFSWRIILPLFMTVTLISLIIYRTKRPVKGNKRLSYQPQPKCFYKQVITRETEGKVRENVA